MTKTILTCATCGNDFEVSKKELQMLQDKGIFGRIARNAKQLNAKHWRNPIPLRPPITTKKAKTNF